MLSGTLYRPGINPTCSERLTPILEIGDPQLRHEMVDAIMETYATAPANAEQARAALEAANVPEEWKTKWRAAFAGKQ